MSRRGARALIRPARTDAVARPDLCAPDRANQIETQWRLRPDLNGRPFSLPSWSNFKLREALPVVKSSATVRLAPSFLAAPMSVDYPSLPAISAHSVRKMSPVTRAAPPNATSSKCSMWSADRRTNNAVPARAGGGLRAGAPRPPAPPGPQRARFTVSGNVAPRTEKAAISTTLRTSLFPAAKF